MIFYIILAYVVGICGFVGFRIFKRWKYRKIKLRTLILHNTQVYEEKNVVVNDDRVLIEKKWKPKVKVSAIFTKKGNPSKKLIIFPYGKEKPLQFKEGKDDVDEFTEGWTRKEVIPFIKKLSALGKAEFKPISRLEFIVLCALIIINIIILIASRGGFRI